METNKITVSTEDELTLSSENNSTYSTTSTDYSEDIDMPFKHWVRGTYNNISRKFKFKANAPGAHPLFTSGEYTLRCNGTENSTLLLFDSNNTSIDPSTAVLASESGIDYSITVTLEYNQNYYFVITGNPDSTNYFEVRIDYRSYTASTPCDYSQYLEPHGNYHTFTCKKAASCTDGVGGNSYNDKHYVNTTSLLPGTLNASIHRYIVIPEKTPNYASFLGCVGVAIRKNGRYAFGVVGDVGSSPKTGTLDEFSKKMLDDLGFEVNGGDSVEPEECVTTYIFTDTKKKSWNGDTLNEDVETVGRRYFY